MIYATPARTHASLSSLYLPFLFSRSNQTEGSKREKDKKKRKKKRTSDPALSGRRIAAHCMQIPRDAAISRILPRLACSTSFTLIVQLESRGVYTSRCGVGWNLPRSFVTARDKRSGRRDDAGFHAFLNLCERDCGSEVRRKCKNIGKTGSII